MRCCFQNGVGDKQFSDNLNVVHRHHYEMLEVQYMETILARAETSAGRSRTYLPFPDFEDKGPNRFNALIPSGQWLRDMYDKFTSGIKADKRQSRVPVFFRTPNVLTRSFGARQSIAGCWKHWGNGHRPLPCLKIAPSQQTSHSRGLVIESHEKEFDQHTSTLGSDIYAIDHSHKIVKHIGVFDALLTVTNGKGQIRVCDLVPTKAHSQFTDHLAQMNESFNIYGLPKPRVFYTNNLRGDKRMLEESFPSLLQNMIPISASNNLSPAMITAPITVLSTVTQMQDAALTLVERLPKDENGRLIIGLDLEWNVDMVSRQQGIPDRRQTAILQIAYDDHVWIFQVLKENLEKPNDIRVGMEWGNEELSDAQQQYAALDAWISLRVYQQLIKLESPSPVDFPLGSPPIGLEVFVLQDDRTTIIAKGTISPKTLYTTVHTIKVTSTRTVIDITEVYISVLGTSVFDSTMDSTASGSSLSTEIQHPEDPIILDLHKAPVSIDFSDVNVTELTEVSLKNITVDNTALQECNEIIDELASLPWPGETRSRVLKDIFHVFQLIYISRTHGLRVTFAQALREVIFIPNSEDKRRLIAYLSRQPSPMTWEECLRAKPAFIKKHCRHLYGPLKDAATGLPLFNAAAWKTIKNILELIKGGYISDPPDVELYSCLGTDSNGLPIYSRGRGTNFTEGAVHRPIRHCLPIGGASPRHTSTRLKDFMLKHNLIVGTYNTTGQHYRGHYDLWLTNRRQRLLNSELIKQLIPSSSPLAGWVNGDLYVQTKEVFGILPIPESVKLSSHIIAYDEQSRPKRFTYLARKQDAHFTVLSVHTTEERQLFSNFMHNDISFSGPSGPDFFR
ncbi:hypothetical protein C8J56DRAFT_1058250 [Mycena floridula]|nr:hypothetical protein C8J56DRAFT_1058250 [Mycena floridula]